MKKILLPVFSISFALFSLNALADSPSNLDEFVGKYRTDDGKTAELIHQKIEARHNDGINGPFVYHPYDYYSLREDNSGTWSEIDIYISEENGEIMVCDQDHTPDFDRYGDHSKYYFYSQACNTYNHSLSVYSYSEMLGLFAKEGVTLVPKEDGSLELKIYDAEEFSIFPLGTKTTITNWIREQ